MNFRNLGIWAAIIIALAGMYALMNPSQRTATVSELSYSQLLAKIDGGSVKSVEMAGPKIIVKDSAGKTFASTTPNNQEDLVKRLEARNVDIKVKPPGGMSAGAILLQLLPIIIMVGIWIFFMRQMQGGARGAMGFGKSKAKMLTENRNRVTFEDVAGVDEAKEELSEIVDFLKDPGKFQRLGGKIPKGALMVGPPGTGKTLLGRAVAGEAGVPFFYISGSDFVEMFVGVGASRVRDMFEQA